MWLAKSAKCTASATFLESVPSRKIGMTISPEKHFGLNFSTVKNIGANAAEWYESLSIILSLSH
jgi:hypothetical protein